MSGAIILDTGPWVSFLCRRDEHHNWSVQQFSSLQDAPITCEAVLTETCFLLARFGFDPAEPLRMIENGLIRLSFPVADQIADVRSLFERYDNVPASLADACLIRMAEIHADSKVLTLDRDFSIYRKSRKRAIPLIAPWA